MTNAPAQKFARQTLSLLCAAVILLAAPMAEAVAVKKKDPISGARRTLFATLGQTTMVFEAPKGMCFMDESRVTENAVLKSMKDSARDTGDMLIAVFADCKELAGLGVVDDGGSLMLKRKGTIVWSDPARPTSRKMLRKEYVDLRAPTYREDQWNDMLRAFTKHGRMKKRVEGALTTATYMANPEDYQFDAKPHVTDEGVSLAYGVDTVIEYKKLTAIGATGTTLIRHMPLEFNISQSGDRRDHDFAPYYKMMDGFIAQQVRLNQ